MKSRVNVKNVAELARVSPSTVSNVFTGNQHVREATAKRVLEAARELGYYPNGVARSLRSGVNTTIAAIIEDLHSPSVMSVLRGIEDTAYRRSFTLYMANLAQKADKEEYYINSLLSNNVAGVLLQPTGSHKSLYKRLSQLIPVVFIDRRFTELSISSVSPDHKSGALMATKHLIHHGHNKIGVISAPQNLTPGSLRLQGFLEAAEELGIPREQRLIKIGPSTREFGYHAARELLEENKDVTALYVTTSSLTVGAIRALLELDIRIPENIAMIGSGSFELASLLSPSITSVVYDFHLIGELATELLFSMIDKSYGSHEPTLQEIEPKLEIRKSCGC